jgi:hypothetical protein
VNCVPTVVQIVEKREIFRLAYIYLCLLRNYEKAFRRLEINVPRDRTFRKRFADL